MNLPTGFLDELRARLTLSEIVGRRVRLTRAGREFKACCPFHKEKSPSFTVNDQKGFYHCFGCGAHGDVIGFTMRIDNRGFMEAVEVLANLAGMPVPQATPEEHKAYEKEKNLYTLIDAAASWFEEQLYGNVGRMALDYAKKRGLGDATIRAFRLGFAPQDGQALITFLKQKGYAPEQMMEAGLAKKAENEDRIYSFFRGRLIFPVGDRRGRVVAFGARILEGEGPKYINSAEHSLFHKGQLLYGFSRARAAAGEGKPIIITEGYMDVIRLVDAGFRGAVAPLGTALTEDQILALWKIIPKPPVRPDLLNHIPILCFDGDGAGQRAATRALERILPHLAADQSVRFAAMPEGEDPDSLIKAKGPTAMQQILDKALPLADFLWQSLGANRPLNTPEDRAGFRRDLDARIALIKDQAVQRDYRQSIHKKLEENFAPATTAASFAPRHGFGRKNVPAWKNRFGHLPVMKARPLPGNLQERIVLALLINHPALFDEMEEALNNLPLADAALAPLRAALFDFMHQHAADGHETAVEAAALKDHLEQAGFGGILQSVLGVSLTMHAGFAKPDRALEEARAGWHDIWQQHLRAQLVEELKSASLELKNDNSAATLERIQHLQAMLVEIDEAADKAAG